MITQGKVYTLTTVTVDHSAPERLPIIHRTALLRLGASESVKISEIHAEKNAPVTTPANKRTRTSIFWLWLEETANTMDIAKRDPIKAAAGRVHAYEATNPRERTNTAPVAAPLEIPRMYGSARGFLSKA